jgi:hypothetical protein
MRILVKRNYGGRPTRERRILPGEYDSNDPALFGVADYLLENGFAVAVNLSDDAQTPDLGELSELSEPDGQSPDTSVFVSEPDGNAVAIDSLSYTELRQLVSDMGIELTDGRSREALIEAITAHGNQ